MTSLTLPVSLGSPTSALLVKEMIHVLIDEAIFTWVACQTHQLPIQTLSQRCSCWNRHPHTMHYHLEAPNRWPHRRAKRQVWGAVEAEVGSKLELHRWLRTWS